MTVATDLQLSAGIKRAVLLKIHGFEPILFETQDDLTPAPSGWTRSVIACLEPPEESSMGFDFSTMCVAIDGLVFRVSHKDTDGADYFGKMFSPARWDRNPHARIADATDWHQQIDADATTIAMNDTTLLPSSGTGYIGQETISWSGKTGTTLTGVQKGLYPAAGDGAYQSGYYGSTYQRVNVNQKGRSLAVGTVPFTWMGRMVAAYITTWDARVGEWATDGSEELFYTGTISREITQEPDGKWRIETTSLVESLDRKICTTMAQVEMEETINLWGDFGRRFTIEERQETWSILVATGVIEVAKGSYTPASLAKAISDELADSGNWTTEPAQTSYGSQSRMKVSQSGKAVLQMRTGNTTTAGAQRNIFIYPWHQGYPCHALNALGFKWWTDTVVYSATPEMSSGLYGKDETASNEPLVLYHPLNRKCNGSRLYVDDVGPLIPDQGDGPTAQACVMIKDAILDVIGTTETKGGYLVRYSARDTTNNYLTLTTRPGWPEAPAGHLARKAADKPVEVDQVFVPWTKASVAGTHARRPFDVLLSTLVSTGTSGYNRFYIDGGPSYRNYDKLPPGWGLGIPADLIDLDSFDAADAHIGCDPLGDRYGYVIGPDTSWLELFQREAKLFGYGLTQRNGQLSLTNIYAPRLSSGDLTIGDATAANEFLWPENKQSVDTVINEYKCEVVYDYRTNKYAPAVFVTEADSAECLHIIKQQAIKHPGVWIGNKAAAAKALLESTLLRRFMRFSSPVVTDSLSGTHFRRVYPGQIVIYDTTRVMDPTGSGLYDTTCYATVLNLQWEFPAYVASIELLLHTRDFGFGNPWAPSALVDFDENTGDYDAGWNPTTRMLKLVSTQFGETGDMEDGSAFVAGFSVIVLGRTSPTSVFGPFELESGYDAHNNELAVPVTVNMAAWDNTLEYVVLFADHALASAAQLLVGTWQADATTELLSADGYAQRYG